MLARHIIGYIPSFVIPAIAAFASIYCYTRLLTPQEYGHYALTINTMTLMVAVAYSWLQASLPRLLPQAVKQGTYERFKVTAQVIFALVSLALTGVVALCAAFDPASEFTAVAWPALFLTIARALLNQNQAFHRSNLNFNRYNLIECGQAAMGLCGGLALVYFAQLGARGAIMGLAGGMMCMALLDLRQWITAPYRECSGAVLKEIAHFGVPLMLSFGLAVIISTSDRFLIAYFLGSEQVGIYAAGYTLTDRIIGIVFLMIAIPSLPLTVHKLEHEGMEAAREQTRRNGIAAFMLALPACAGLMLANRQIAHAFIGPAFRDGALTVMPWIAISGMFNGLATHYFDHAFHLGKKTSLFVFTLGPSALLSVMLNLLLIPRFGIVGAAWSTLSSYALLLTLSATVGRRAFAIRFPFKEALQVSAAVLLMAAALRAFVFPETLAGLMAMMALGGATYVGGLLLFDVMDTRAWVLKAFKRGAV